ncbi:MAG: hypothetical protein KDC48_19920, partial [Planctomycetes bacterium]|nr:hypothetical protein [Planctomycetota bacterium]
MRTTLDKSTNCPDGSLWCRVMRLASPTALARVLVAAGLAAQLGAQQPVITVPVDSHLQVRSWDATSGLPQNTVCALQFDRDGMLWVATFGGLCRFDGMEWRVEATSADGLQDQRITLVAQDASGQLLVGTEQGALFGRRDGHFTLLAQVPGTNLRFASTEPSGRLLCGTSSGLFARLEGGTVIELADRSRRDPRAFLPFADGPQVVGRGGVFRLDDPNREVLVEEPCSSAVMLRDGRAILGTDRGLFAYDGRSAQPLTVPGAPVDAGVSALAVTAAGLLWVGAEGSLCRIDPDGVVPPLVLPIAHRVRAILVEGDRALWVGFEGGGLARLFDSEVDLHTPRAAAGQAVEPHSVLPAGDGRWWVGTAGGLFSFDGQHFEADARLAGIAIGGLARSASGDLWLGVDAGVTRLRGDDVRHFRAPSPGRVRAIHIAGDDRIWCGTEDGVRWLQEGRWSEPPEALLLRGEAVKMIVPTAGGRLWIASDSTLLRVEPDLRVTLRLRNGVELPPGEVRAVLPTASSRVWLGCYGGGFVAVDGDRLRRVGAAEGLLDPFVCSAVPFGGQWVVGSNRGTFVVDPAALDRVVDGITARLACRPLFGPRGAAAEANGGVQPSMA